MAPGRIWVRPRTHIYCDNYNFGSNLYSEALEALNKKYFPHFSSDLVITEKKSKGVVRNGQFLEPPASENDLFFSEDERTGHTSSLQRSSTTIFNQPEVSPLPPYPTSDVSCIEQDVTKRHQMQEKHGKRRQARSFHEVHLRYLEDRHEALQYQFEQEEREREEQERNKRAALPVFLEKDVLQRFPQTNLHNLKITAEEELAEIPNERCNQMKIEQLTKRLEETESKIKTEVARVKKQYQLQVTELEMSLDSANKHNIDLQKTTKKQNLQITVRLK
ncbi:paramyosin-like [Limulus polyphemus]|uniref:Paramyosin-like n=1 Tax=Limulus polyphemus TaxID=6850 RepID=A0ABM1RV08_LIMPO|nr:paramyosin-like [Limulus polyphemus]